MPYLLNDTKHLNLAVRSTNFKTKVRGYTLEVPRFLVGKVGISAVNMEKTLGLIIKQVSSRNSAYICVANVRTAGLSQSHEEFCRISNQSFLTVPDGMPLVWYARIGEAKGVERVSGADLMHQILSISKEREYSHYFYGSISGFSQYFSNMGRLSLLYGSKKIFDRTYAYGNAIQSKKYQFKIRILSSKSK